MYFAVPGIHYQWRFVLYSRRCCLLVCSSVVCWGKQVMLSSLVTFCQFVCLSVFVSVFLSFFPSVCLCLFVGLCLPVSFLFMSVCLSVSQYLSLSVCLSVCVSFCWSVCQSVLSVFFVCLDLIVCCLSASLLISVSVCQSVLVCLICLSVYQSVSQSVRLLAVCLLCMSVHLWDKLICISCFPGLVSIRTQRSTVVSKCQPRQVRQQCFWHCWNVLDLKLQPLVAFPLTFVWWVYLLKSVDGMLMVCWWYVDGMLMVCWWYVDGVLMVWWYDGMLMVCWWYVDGIMVCWCYLDHLMVFWWYVDGVLMVCWQCVDGGEDVRVVQMNR